MSGHWLSNPSFFFFFFFFFKWGNRERKEEHRIFTGHWRKAGLIFVMVPVMSTQGLKLYTDGINGPLLKLNREGQIFHFKLKRRRRYGVYKPTL